MLKRGVILIGLALLGVCASAQSLSDVAGIENISIVNTLEKVTACFDLSVKSNAVAPDQIIILTPRLSRDGSVTILQQVVIEGKKAKKANARNIKRNGKSDYPENSVCVENGSYSKFNLTIPFEKWMGLGADFKIDLSEKRYNKGSIMITYPSEETLATMAEIDMKEDFIARDPEFIAR